MKIKSLLFIASFFILFLKSNLIFAYTQYITVPSPPAGWRNAKIGDVIYEGPFTVTYQTLYASGNRPFRNELTLFRPSTSQYGFDIRVYGRTNLMSYIGYGDFDSYGSKYTATVIADNYGNDGYVNKSDMNFQFIRNGNPWKEIPKDTKPLIIRYIITGSGGNISSTNYLEVFIVIPEEFTKPASCAINTKVSPASQLVDFLSVSKKTLETSTVQKEFSLTFEKVNCTDPVEATVEFQPVGKVIGKTGMSLGNGVMLTLKNDNKDIEWNSSFVAANMPAAQQSLTKSFSASISKTPGEELKIGDFSGEAKYIVTFK